MADHDHHHLHDEPDHSPAGAALDLRVRALESLLAQKGYIDPAALDVVIDTYQTKIGPQNGARVVARAWTDPAYRQWLLEDATAAIAALGFTGRQGEHMMALENRADVHHLVVCTLCSCYPWPVLGLPPAWYKSTPYRSRAVKDPRGVLRDFGVVLPKTVRIRVWDSTAELRYLVIPQRPAAAAALGEEELVRWVTRDSMIGTGMPRPPGGRMSYRSHADLGGSANDGAILADPHEVLFHAPWEPRVLALVVAMGAAGLWNIDMSRAARETLPNYAALSYYEIWLAALEKLLLATDAVTPAELRDGRLRQPAAVHKPSLGAAAMADALRRGAPAARTANQPARFSAGQRVRTLSRVSDHHTRLPAYARGKQGVVEKVHGAHVFPDSHAHGGGETPQWLYSVSFEAAELWGAATRADELSSVSIDAWEPYLEAL